MVLKYISVNRYIKIIQLHLKQEPSFRTGSLGFLYIQTMMKIIHHINEKKKKNKMAFSSQVNYTERPPVVGKVGSNF
jgi:hypothetical protein